MHYLCLDGGSSIILDLALDGCIPQARPCSFEINIGGLGEGRGDPAAAPIVVGVSPKDITAKDGGQIPSVAREGTGRRRVPARPGFSPVGLVPRARSFPETCRPQAGRAVGIPPS